MRFFFFIAVLLASCTWAPFVGAQSYQSGLVEIQDPKNEKQFYVGEVVRENDKGIEIRDLDGTKKAFFKSRRVKSGSVEREIPLKVRHLNEQDAIKAVGLAPYLAWHIGRRLYKPGKVVSIGEDGCYVSVGSDDWVTQGQELVVYRLGPEIKDPETGKALGHSRQEVGRVEVLDTTQNLSRVDTEECPELRVGDEVRFDPHKSRIAVLPLITIHGNPSDPGNRFAEEMTTALVRLDVPVVERTLIAKVLNRAERADDGGISKEFDPKAVADFGRQLGAYFIVAGTVNVPSLMGRTGLVTANGNPEMYVRLIKVETGEILFAAQRHDPSVFVQVISDEESARKLREIESRGVGVMPGMALPGMAPKR